MERKSFINLAFLLPFLGSLRSIVKDDVLLHFDLSELDPLLKNISPGDLAKANMLRKNLAFDVQYVLERIKNPRDMEAIKILATEADKKFYAENKLAARGFGYQPLSIEALGNLRDISVAGTKEFDGMLKDIRDQLSSLQGSKEKYVKEAVQKLAGIGPQKYRPSPAENAKQAQQCARTWTMVGAIVATVVVIVIAIIISVFSFGAAGPAMATTVIGAVALLSANVSKVITVTSNTIKIDDKEFSLRDSKVDLGSANLDSLLKCSTSAASVASAISYFGKTAYPANPLAGSLVVNLIGIVGKMPGYGINC